MTVKELAKKIYADNVAKGYDGHDKYLSRLMIITEICEAVEAIRKDYISYLMDYKRCKHNDGDDCGFLYDKIIHHSLIDELADIMIRSLDYMERFAVDINGEAVTGNLSHLFQTSISATSEILNIEELNLEETAEIITCCIGDVFGDDDGCFLSGVMPLAPILAAKYKLSIADLEYVINEKIEYNKSSKKKAF